MSDPGPVGVFDSGVGGLSVAMKLRELLPSEDLVYLADHAFCPYGGRPLEEIRARSLAVSRFLISKGAKVIVVACNSASAAALETLRAELRVPIVGMEPAVKPAAAATRVGRVGVMATEATLSAERFDRLMASYAVEVDVVSQACPGLVELVERGVVDGDEARSAVEPFVAPLRQAGVDTVVLGCTHYPFLRAVIQERMGDEVRVLDTGEAVARQTARVLADADALALAGTGGVRVYTTGSVDEVRPVVQLLWGSPVPVEEASL
jgi:glutamate racemase